MVGNILYMIYTLTGTVSSFPALPEAAFFVMALFFSLGMFRYGQVRQQVNRVQVYNYVLISCAVILASLFVLHESLARSAMASWPTFVAFIYPALWFSVAVSGLITLLIYPQGAKSFGFALMVMAVLAEAVADFSYATQLLAGTYTAGGETQLPSNT